MQCTPVKPSCSYDLPLASPDLGLWLCLGLLAVFAKANLTLGYPMSQDLGSIDKHSTDPNECMCRLTLLLEDAFFSSLGRKISLLPQLSSSSTPHGENESIDDDDDDDNDDDVQEAGTAAIKVSIYTPVHN